MRQIKNTARRDDLGDLKGRIQDLQGASLYNPMDLKPRLEAVIQQLLTVLNDQNARIQELERKTQVLRGFGQEAGRNDG